MHTFALLIAALLLSLFTACGDTAYEEEEDSSKADSTSNDTRTDGEQPADDDSTIDAAREECDPAHSATCVCTLTDGRVCVDPAAAGCDCFEVGTDACGGSEGCDQNNGTTHTDEWPDEDPILDGTLRFVVVEDLSDEPSSRELFPGADIDSISVTVRGIEHFASSFEDFMLAEHGEFIDPAQVLGAPDSACISPTLANLGGGFIMVGFDTTFGSGDSVTVYELGPTTCPGLTELDQHDEPYAIYVGTNTDSFVEIGQGGTGVNTIVVP